MLQAVKQKVVTTLPETKVLALVRLRHGEQPWQLRMKARIRAALGRPPLDR